MAKMIPSEIGYFDPKSGEDKLYKALENLPSDYYVFHSYRVVGTTNNQLEEYEIDFLIFNPKYGCLLLEAKNGRVYRDLETKEWHYQDGRKMKDPFIQVASGMHALVTNIKNEYKDSPLINLIKKCKFLFSIWFPSYSKKELQEINFGPNFPNDLVIGSDALKNPTQSIEKIMKLIQIKHIVYNEPKIIEDANNYKHGLDEKGAYEFLKYVLCPCFDIVPELKKKYEEEKYDKLLRQQAIVLKFLKEQKTAAIAGTSGTGKTMIALERARELSSKNKVLFLCYNPNLEEHLKKLYSNQNIDFYTIGGFACMKTKKSTPDYDLLREIISQELCEDKFIYKHIIVDEGQDFGRKEIEDSKVMNLLFDYGKNSPNCSFYVFYDKFQLVNCSDRVPDFISESDSKITLYKNCRNTKKIADVAYSLIENKVKPQMFEGAIVGEDVEFFFYESKDELINRLDNMIEKCSTRENYSRAIITCRSIAHNSLDGSVDKFNVYKSSSGLKTKLYSASTFKGLEADFVFLIDVNLESFEEKNLSFYVGASRAKSKLYVFINLSELQAQTVIQSKFPDSFPAKSKKYQLASRMHGIYKQ